MRRFLFDTAIFSYAVGRAHPYREPCRRIIEAAERGELRGEASVDLIQEYAHQRARRTGDRKAAVAEAMDVTALCQLWELRAEDVHTGLALFLRHPSLDARDAVFVAVALNRGIDAILATDHAFDGIEGLERIDPMDEAAVASLVGSA